MKIYLTTAVLLAASCVQGAEYDCPDFKSADPPADECASSVDACCPCAAAVLCFAEGACGSAVQVADNEYIWGGPYGNCNLGAYACAGCIDTDSMAGAVLCEGKTWVAPPPTCSMEAVRMTAMQMDGKTCLQSQMEQGNPQAMACGECLTLDNDEEQLTFCIAEEGTCKKLIGDDILKDALVAMLASEGENPFTEMLSNPDISDGCLACYLTKGKNNGEDGSTLSCAGGATMVDTDVLLLADGSDEAMMGVSESGFICVVFATMDGLGDKEVKEACLPEGILEDKTKLEGVCNGADADALEACVALCKDVAKEADCKTCLKDYSGEAACKMCYSLTSMMEPEAFSLPSPKCLAPPTMAPAPTITPASSPPTNAEFSGAGVLQPFAASVFVVSLAALL